MPNKSNDDVIIVGSLSDKELRDSIDKLVDYVGDKTTIMAGKFDVAIEKMKSAMKDFAITQKVSVDLMKEAWRDMSSSFDAMMRAESTATSGGGGGGGKPSVEEGTVRWLEQQSKLQKEVVRDQKLGTTELQNEVDKHAAINEQLKNELKSTKQIQQEMAKRTLKNVLSLPQNELKEAEYRLKALLNTASAYKTRKSGILSEEQWHKLNNAIAKTRQQIDKLQEKKPKSLKDVLGMDESSLDSITAKMRALKRVQIDPNNANQVKQLGDEYQRLKRLQAELMGQNIQMTHSNNYLAQSFGYIRNRIVYALTLGAITSFTKQVYEIRGQYELLERSLGVLVNSFERGSQIFQELNQMAIESPFTLMELAGAAKQLTAYNFAANEVVDTTRRLADISAALGVPMERLTYNLGQIRAQTVLTARDARDFANAGLPIVASLAEHFTELEGRIVTTGDVYDRMSKKMVSYSDVMSVLNKMTDEGGKFFNFQAKQAETLRVQMANLNLAWNNMLNDIGKSNQGLLTLPINILKALFANWQSIGRVIKSMLYTFVAWKALQVVAIRQQWAWASATGATAKQMGRLANGIKSVGASLASISSNPWTWVFIGGFAIIDLVRQANDAKKAIHELNQEIRDNANEASESMLNYLNNKGNKSTFELAKQNKLTAEQGERAWESLKQQIEQSALSANGLISELLAIEDVNERVRVGFDYAERIQKAQAALQDLADDTIVVTTDTGWGGMFGEGLVSDLIDYTEALERYAEIRERMATEVFTSNFEENMGWGALRLAKSISESDKNEFLEELDETAESINHFIQAYNITDPLQINEILERVRSQIKAKNPEIKGEMAKIFDISLDQKMATLTNGAVDRNASLWNMFMERLKNRYHHAFEDITDEWVETGKGLSEAQEKELKKAIDANLKYFQDSMPLYYQSIKEMVDNASALRIKIGLTFGGTALTNFQKEVNSRIANAPKTLEFGNSLPTSNDDLVSWTKTQQQAIKKLQEENEKYSLDNTEWSKKRIKNNNDEIQQHKNLLDLFHQEYKEHKEQKNSTKPEDAVAEALKQEIQLIKEMQSNYDKLRKSGVSNMDAIDMASRGYEMTILRINNVLQKFGIDKFNASNFAGKDVRNLLSELTRQRDALMASGKVKTSSLQALDVEIQKLNIDAKTYDLKKITDGLNSELGKFKEEYELAVELDANPELGDVFADLMGLSKDDLSSLPRGFEDALKKMQAIIDKELGVGVFNLADNLNKGMFRSWVEQQGKAFDSDQIKALEKYVDEANKIRRNEAENQIKEWDKLLKKYAEYEYKRKQILEQYDREIAVARKKNASQDILDAVENRRDKELASLDFDEFTKTSDWIVATGDLASLSKSAIGMLITELERYKLSAKNLDAKQIKQINSALSKLYKEQRKNNPFRAISNMLQEAKERAEQYQDEIDDVQKEMEDLGRKSIGGLNGDEKKRLDELIKKWEELKKKQQAAGKIDATQWVSAINETVGAVQQAVGVFDDLAKAISGINTSVLDEAFSVLEKGGQAAAIGAQVGGGYGAIIGAVAGVASGLIQVFGNSRNESITDSVQRSENAVKRLETAYIDLEHAVNEAYGVATIGAKKLAIANKELQLVEIKRQLALEESRDSKNKDAGRIADLQKQIKEMEYEIKDSTNEIVNDLLGISSVGDAMENMMDGFVEALRNGEDAMTVFNENVDEMIANMVKKMFATKVLQPWFDEQWNTIQADINKRGNAYADEIKELQAKKLEVQNKDLDVFAYNVDDIEKKYLEGLNVSTLSTYHGATSDLHAIVGGRDMLTIYDRMIEDLQNQLLTAAMPNTDDIKQWAQLLRSGQPVLEENMQAISDYLRELGLINESKDSSLSALRQGIQGVTEDTAGAIEAYMNIVAQRVFAQNLYLQEIRDHLNNFDLDVQLGTLSQMLLQLQQSYQVQQNIESILTGVLNPSGRAIVVELNS